MKVFIIAAVTVDGFIAVDQVQKATSWTSKADLDFFVAKTKEAGTVVMGRTTFDTIGNPLKDRRVIVLTSHPGDMTVEGVEATNESPRDLMGRLQSENVQNVAICGGANVYQQFVNAGLVDELYISVIPKIFGAGIPLFDKLVDKDLTLLEVTKLEDDNTILLHYSLVKSAS